MAIPENVRNNWIEIQKKFEYPVNAIGVKIEAKDSKTLQVWKSEGIDQCPDRPANPFREKWHC